MKKYYIFITILTVCTIAIVLMVNTSKRTVKKQAELNKAEWAEILANHPYNQRAPMSPEELKTIPKADRPDLAMEQEFLMTMDPALGAVPTERLKKVHEKVKNKNKLKSAIAGVEWQERGPNEVGGRTRALMFDPNDETNKKVWAGGVSGGLWYTNDITASTPVWNHVDDFWDNIIVSCIAYNPTNTLEFYVGTGEGWFNGDAQRGGGIWKTSDGGATWDLLGATEPGSYNNSSHFHYVNKIVIKANGTIFAATRGWFINNGGIMRSTNGGINWTRVLTQYVSETNYYDRGADIEIAANGDLYASIGIKSAGQVFKSLNADNGALGTWTNLSSNITMNAAERVELACAPSDANVIYAVADGGSGDTDVEWFKKSIDGGNSWSSLPIPLMVDGSGDHFTRGQAFYDLILAVHPTDPDLVIVGGIDLHRSTNGGTSFAPISHWYGGFSQPEVHADQHAIVFRPGASNEMLFGNDGGIFYSTNAGDAGATPAFVHRNTGYNVTQFYACAAKNEINSNYFLAGAQDNGSQQFTLPQIGNTTEVSGGDGAFCHIDQNDPNIQTTAYTYSNIYRSLDGGNSFPSLITESTGHFINPSEYDSQRKILYLAANEDTLKRISGMDGTITKTDFEILVGTKKVSALKISPYNDVLFLGITNARIYKYTDASTGSPTLTRIDNGTLPIITTGWVSSIDVGADDNNLLITYSNYGVTSVWETTDGGINWYSKEGDLPDMPVRWALYNPENRNEVLLATEVGVWSTDNFGTGTSSAPDWEPSNSNLAHTRCTMLKYRPADKMVVVSTHGRGLFTSDIFVGTSIAVFTADQVVSCTGSLTVQFTDGSLKPNNSWAWDFGDGTSINTSQNPTHTYSSPGLYSVKLTINSGAATITKENFILVMSSEPTVNTGCNLSSNSNNGNGYGIGIYRFAIGSIDNTTPHNDGFYQNYTCSQWTNLELNKTYNVTIQTGTANAEGARVYIDYNDNGTFETGESVASFPANDVGTRFLSFTTPSSGVVIEKELRLRVLSKFSGIPINACNISSYGQAEDYTVTFARPQWNGNTDTDWITASNWSINEVPASDINVKIPPDRPNYPVLTSDVTCNNLTIETGASVTVNPGIAMTVEGALTNNGVLTINSDALAQNGSLIVNGTSTGDVTYNRYLVPERWFITSGPVNVTSGFNTLNSSAIKYNSTYNDYDFAWYDELDNFGWRYLATIPSSLTLGRGYITRLLTGNTNINYTGTLNGDVTVPVTSTGTLDGWNAIGNPYTSAIKVQGADGFITTNLGALAADYAAIYLWNDGAYRVISNSGYTPEATVYSGGTLTDPNVQAGQGFLVNALYNGGASSNINFTKGTSGLQIHDVGRSLKSATISWPGVTLLVENGGETRSTIVCFNDKMTEDVDISYDAGLLSASNFNLFTKLIKAKGNKTDFAIQCLPDNQYLEMTVPLGIVTPNTGQYTFKATGIILPAGIYPVLEDRKQKVKIPLKTEADSYSVELKYGIKETGRFYLSFANGTKSGKIEEIAEIENYNLTARYSEQIITIFGKIEEGAKAALYDINGRKIVDEYWLSGANYNEIPAPVVISGVYILKISGKSTNQIIKVPIIVQ